MPDHPRMNPRRWKYDCGGAPGPIARFMRIIRSHARLPLLVSPKSDHIVPAQSRCGWWYAYFEFALGHNISGHGEVAGVDYDKQCWMGLFYTRAYGRLANIRTLSLSSSNRLLNLVWSRNQVRVTRPLGQPQISVLLLCAEQGAEWSRVADPPLSSLVSPPWDSHLSLSSTFDLGLANLLVCSDSLRATASAPM
jgi:hypothetical protein